MPSFLEGVHYSYRDGIGVYHVLRARPTDPFLAGAVIDRQVLEMTSPETSAEVQVEMLAEHKGITRRKATSVPILPLFQGRTPETGIAEVNMLGLRLDPPTGIYIPRPVTDSEIADLLAVAYFHAGVVPRLRNDIGDRAKAQVVVPSPQMQGKMPRDRHTHVRIDGTNGGPVHQVRLQGYVLRPDRLEREEGKCRRTEEDCQDSLHKTTGEEQIQTGLGVREYGLYRN